MIVCKQELAPTYLKLPRLYPYTKKVVKKRLKITDLSLFFLHSTRFLKKFCIEGNSIIGEKKVLSDQEFGVRKNRSTHLVVTYLYETISQIRD